MDLTIQPRLLRGEISIIPSKSQAHRLLICAAFADKPTQLRCPDTSQDIEATTQCLRSLGAQIIRTDSGYSIFPVSDIPKTAVLNCHESGSTLRFLLPVCGALGVETTFLMEGRLSKRPLSPLWEEMERMGCTLTRPSESTILCTGKLKPGNYRIDGSVSSQYITGLMLALSVMNEHSTLEITGTVESKPYIALTRDALSLFDADPDSPGTFPLRSPGYICVEGDWSNGAFFLAADALGSHLTITGLNENSNQGDRAIGELLSVLNSESPVISVADIPDLVPILSVVAACNKGAVFTQIRRLRFKESDRVASVISMIESLGGCAWATEDTLTVAGSSLIGGTVDCMNDHRITMSAAIAATVCQKTVTLLGAEAVQKSYPRFWEEYANLGGKYEQYLR